jgi:WD40 repeat protein
VTKVWDAFSGELLRDGLKERNNGGPPVTTLAGFVSAEGRSHVVVGWFPGAIAVYDPEAGAGEAVEVCSMGQVHGNQVSALVCVEARGGGGVLVLSGSHDGSAAASEAGTGRRLYRVTGSTGPHDRKIVGPLAVYYVKERAGEGVRARFATGCLREEDGRIDLWDLESGAGMGVLAAHTDAVHCLEAFATAEGAYRLVSGADDYAVCVWAPEVAQAPLYVLRPYVGSVRAMHVFESRQGRYVLAIGGDTGRVKLLDLGEAPVPEPEVKVLRAAHKLG